MADDRQDTSPNDSTSASAPPTGGLQRFFSRRPHTLPALAAAIFLAVAIGRWPYGYYTLTRWVTCAVAVFVAYSAYDWEKIWAVWCFGFIAILFNPIAPIHLSREIWQPLDIAASVAFVVGIVIVSRSIRTPPTN